MEQSSGEKNRGLKPFTIAAIIVFALVASGHLLRLLLGWEVMLNGMIVPMWVSAPGLVIAAGLALMLWLETRS
ncbi:MAG: hypothetical protein Q7J12_08200 [Syntrophales bacterium]|nr:hypothetical protein [Syntrophales bacterium]